MAFRRLLVPALVNLLTAAGCGSGERASIGIDASNQDGSTSVADAVSTTDGAEGDAASADCVERTDLVLGCVLPEVSCLTTNPCPATWSEAQVTCPLDGTMALATSCGFNRWSFGPNDSQKAAVTCYFDPATGALRTISEVVPLHDVYCNNTSYQRWTGPKLENCDRSSAENLVTMTCPRSTPLGACPSDATTGNYCGPLDSECMKADGSTCTCSGSLQADGPAWQCLGA
jgi:hypothetical protein